MDREQYPGLPLQQHSHPSPADVSIPNEEILFTSSTDTAVNQAALSSVAADSPAEAIPNQTNPVQQLLGSICRCCLSQETELQSIFDPCQTFPAADMIFHFGGVQIIQNDGFPENICTECLVHLNDCVSFKQRIEAADKFLKQFLINGCPDGVFLQNFSSTGTGVNENPNASKYDDNEDFIIEISTEEIPINIDDEVCSSDIEFVANELEEDEFVDREKKDDVNVFKEPKQSIRGNKAVKEQKLYCEHCKISFNDKPEFSIHMAIHQKNFSCIICTHSFHDQKTLQQHLKLHNSRVSMKSSSDLEPIHRCTTCQEYFATEGDLKIHSSLHVVDPSCIACKECGNKYSTIAQLKRHIAIHFEVKPYKCDSCEKCFSEMHGLTRHYRRHHAGERKERKFVCQTCDKKYADAHALKIHVRTHTGEKPWSCEECGKCFIDSRLLKSHVRTHREEKSFACEECGARFKHQSTLTTHVRTHTGEKPYSCVICSRAFIQASNLRLHMRTHTGEKPFECKTCGKTFSSSSTLKSHERTHTGEKTHSCPECQMKFSRSYLKDHMRTHTGERPFECSKCGNKFTTKSQMRVHLKSHSNEKMYSCGPCGKNWSTLKHYKVHMRKFHKDGKEQRALEAVANNQADSDAELNESEALIDGLLASVEESDAREEQRGNQERNMQV